MQVIFEGPDGAGKTTITERVAKILGVPRIKASVLHDDAKTYTTTFNELLAMSLKPDIIIRDRWYYPSDTIYNPIVAGRMSVFSSGDIEYIEQQLDNVNTLVIIVVAETAALVDRIGIRGDDYIEHSHLTKISEAYSKFILRTKLRTKVLNTTHFSIDLATSHAVNFIKEFYYERYGAEYGSSDNSSN